MIIARYLAKEIGQTLIAVTVILLFVFICNLFVRYLGYVANGKYAAWVLFHIVLLQIPILLGLLLPLGLYLGIILGYGRMYADSEMTVLSACGFSSRQLINITLGFAVIIMVLASILSFWAKPIMTLRSEELLSVAKSGNVLETIVPGRFQIMNKGQRVYYVSKLSHNRKKMGDVFMAETITEKPKQDDSDKKKGKAPQKPRTLWTVVIAKTGDQHTNKKDGLTYIVTHHGHIYKGAPGSADFKIVNYKDYGFRTSQSLNNISADIETVPTSQLIFLITKSRDAAAEFQWRLSIPISVILLTLLAIPLCKLKPRQSKFAKILPAAIIYIVYVNLLFLSREWIENGSVPAWIGVWWVHGLLLVLALWLIWRQRRNSRGFLKR